MILSTIFSLDKKVCEQIQSHPIHGITYCWPKIFYVDVVLSMILLYEKEQKKASWRLYSKFMWGGKLEKTHNIACMKSSDTT